MKNRPLDNVVGNTIFVDGHTMPFGFRNFADNSADNVFSRNIVCWRAAAAGVGRLGKDVEKTLTADYNLFYCAAGAGAVRRDG